MKGLSRTRAAVAGALAVAVFATLGSSAYAGALTYFSGMLAGGSSVQGNYVPLTLSAAQNLATINRKCAGAVNTAGNFHGSYICTTTVDWAEHAYSGTLTLAPMLHNGTSGNSQNLAGHEWW